VGQLLTNLRHVGQHSFGHLLGSVLHIIRADMQNHYLGIDIVQGSVLDAPQDVLGAIVANAEVKAVQRCKVLVPRLAILHSLEDAVAEEDDIRILFPAIGDEAAVYAVPTLVAIQVGQWCGQHTGIHLGGGGHG